MSTSRARGQEPDLGSNPALKWINSRFKIAKSYDGEKFFTFEGGVKKATPLQSSKAMERNVLPDAPKGNGCPSAVTPAGLKLVELAPGVTADEIRGKTGVPLAFPDTVVGTGYFFSTSSSSTWPLGGAPGPSLKRNGVCEGSAAPGKSDASGGDICASMKGRSWRSRRGADCRWSCLRRGYLGQR